VKRFFAVVVAVAASGVLWGGAATAATATVVGPTGINPGGLPMIRAGSPGNGPNSNSPTVSLNWSGYAATSPSKFTSVSGEFVQPAIKCTGASDINKFTSNWVGLDGYTTGTVEQDGTFAWCTSKSGGAAATYEAWYEMFPAGSISVFRVKPGDIMQTSVNFANRAFTLTISDVTSGKSFTTSATCGACQRASAEWIIERPALCNNTGTKCFLTALADFRATAMSGDVAKAGTVTGGIAAFNNFPIWMIDPLKKGFISLDTVSALNPASNSFTATWDRSGSQTPITFGPER
jgi:hypothetical protein